MRVFCFRGFPVFKKLFNTKKEKLTEPFWVDVSFHSFFWFFSRITPPHPLLRRYHFGERKTTKFQRFQTA